ncbi:MAG: hypothetical protein CL946_11845 [Ectothiorhodospiraceae bacterium]|nr:hypothetical protein [Ectothiorhodospiraceae bacterium]
MKDAMHWKSITAVAVFSLFTSLTTAQTNKMDSLKHQGFQRKYVVHVPPGYTGASLVPVVLFLHGGSGNMHSAQNFTMLNPVANANGFLAVYPEGIGPTTGGGYTWADGRGTSADKLGIDDIAFIEKLLDVLESEYKIDSERIYLSGFSNGGFLASRIACENNERFAAIALAGSTLDVVQFHTCSPTRPIPILVLTGNIDPLVPYEGGAMNGNVPDIVSSMQIVKYYIMNNNCSNVADSADLPDIDPSENSTVTVLTYTDCECEATVVHYRINGGGHTWPGVEIPNYELIAGETNEDIQASEELWDFFSAHTLCTKVSSIEDLRYPGSVYLYPNPGNSSVLILSREPILRVRMFNLAGELVLDDSISGTSYTVDLRGISPGIYITNIVTSSKKMLHRKVVVK